MHQVLGKCNEPFIGMSGGTQRDAVLFGAGLFCLIEDGTQKELKLPYWNGDCSGIRSVLVCFVDQAASNDR